MADNKVIKTKAVAAKSKKATEVKTIDQLQADLITKQADLLTARRGNAQGELTNPHIITVLRKEIARIHTAIRAAVINEQKENK